MSRQTIFISLSLTFTACVTDSSTLPGDSLGSYSVEGTLKENTCGSDVGAEDSWDFGVDMSLDDDTLYLDPTDDSDGSQMVSGDVDSDDGTTATLTDVVTTNIKDASGAAGTCNLTLSTTYEVELNDASASKSFEGTVTYTYSAATSVSSNTDCTNQLSSEGGKFDTLPCTVEYELKGTRD